MSRTFQQAAQALLTRYDRAADQLRAALSRPFTVGGCGDAKQIEQATEQVLNVVRDVVTLRQVEQADVQLATRLAGVRLAEVFPDEPKPQVFREDGAGDPV